MNPSIPVLVVALMQAALSGQGSGGATSVSFAPDGRLAAAVRGDLWMRGSGGQWVQLTSGEAWDREPRWAADDVLVFASDRAGGSDIWRLRVGDASCARPAPRASYDAAQLDRECDGNVARIGNRFCHAAGTTAFAVADAEGNVVAVTQTLGTWGGNFYVSPGLGFIYNDKLTSYASDPSSYGARLANARHGSSIAPTMVFRSNGSRRRPVLAAGAAGNAWITSAVYSIVTAVIDAELDVQEAIELPRFLIARRRLDGDTRYVIQLEAGVAPGVLRQLATLGHRFQLISLAGELRMGYAAAITIEDGRVIAAADPRRSGSAGAIN